MMEVDDPPSRPPRPGTPQTTQAPEPATPLGLNSPEPPYLRPSAVRTRQIDMSPYEGRVLFLPTKTSATAAAPAPATQTTQPDKPTTTIF